MAAITNLTESWSGHSYSEIETFLKGKLQAESMTWATLKALRDASGLIAGQFYRITDYTCTVGSTITNATSAGHFFDIITFALDASHLSETAWAAHHDGNTYFASSKLEAWKLWYSLDNDTTKFDWADSTNGKGVIYRMIDEFNNDVPYDFKNIQFYRAWDSSKSLWSTISTSSAGVAAYTFSSTGSSSTTAFTDFSLDGLNNEVFNNVVKEYVDSSSKKQMLNNICFFGTDDYINTFGASCRNNTFADGCYSNTFGDGCYSNTFGDDCYSNTFGDDCYNNTLADGCYSNVFKNNCYSNTLGADCDSNAFGTQCHTNTLASDCCWNALGDGCDNNTFARDSSNNIIANHCYSNSIGDDSSYNILGRGCRTITLGDNCCYNVFGIECNSNTFGRNCCNNTFGNNCDSNTLASDSTGTAGRYFTCNTFENGASYNILYSSETASSSNQVKNYHVKSSIVGTSSAKNTIQATRNRGCDTTVAKNSSGTIKTYCEADVVQ